MWDVAIIGAGVVGLACAERFSRAKMSVLIIERNARRGQETSSRNSGVIHAGIYYPPGTLKADLCVRGNRSLYEWCARRGVPHARTGKWIVGSEEELEPIRARAKACGVDLSFEKIDEPNIFARAALWSPTSGIVDVHALMDSFAAAAACDVAYRSELVGVEPQWKLRVRGPDGDETIEVPRVVNAAGLFADDVARIAGFEAPAQYFVKGNYFRVRKKIVRTLVYPAPPKDLAGLGVHLTVELDGSVKLGPDVVPLGDRTLDYRVDESRKGLFLAAAARYVRGIGEDDLAPDQAGIRPKLSRPGEAPRDFFIAHDRGFVHLVGIESPGITCAIEIAERAFELVTGPSLSGVAE